MSASSTDASCGHRVRFARCPEGDPVSGGGHACARADARTPLARLFDEVAARPHAFDFFALLRRVEALHPDWPRFGRAPRPSQEALRLGQEAELDFAPASLASFSVPAAGVPRLGVRFFGLLGSQGPMPLHLTEFVRERQRFRNDPTAARFLDVFHHRMLALFYRAWSQSQPAVQHDRPGEDRFKVWLGATLGLGSADRVPGGLAESARLFQAGLLGARSRHPEGLAKLLAQYFAVPVRIEQCVAHRMTIEMPDRSRLGRARAGRDTGVAAVLGKACTAGHSLHDRQFKFRVVLGPLTLAQYRRFLPGGPAWLELRDWIRQYAGFDLVWDVRLCLLAAEVPAPRLGRGVDLGLTAWLGRGRRCGTRPSVRDRDDLRLRPDTSFLLQHGVPHHA